jgi:DHA1 family bicyclomycin/chloramphenicol resistance-like MFS transporter
MKPASATNHRLTITAALLAMLGPFTIDTYLPAFPDIEATFGISRAILSQSLGVYLFAFAVSTLFWGPMSDRYGRRMIVLSSLLAYILSTIGCALSNDIETFLFMRFLQGLAASGGFVASRAMIRDAHDAESAHKAMSQVMLMFALAPAVAPILGGWLEQAFGWRSVFWFLCLFATMLMLVVVRAPETLPQHQRRSAHPKAMLEGYLLTLRQPVFIGFVLTMSLGFASLFLYIGGAPTVIYDFLGLGSNDFAWQFIPMVTGMMIGAYTSSQLAHRWPVQKTIKLGFGIMLSASALNLLLPTLLAPSIFSVIGPMVIYTTGIAMALPALTILALDCFPERRGMASAMQGFIQAIINAMVTSLAIPLLHGQLLYFILGQLAFFLLAVFFWRYSTQKRTQMLENQLAQQSAESTKAE